VLIGSSNKIGKVLDVMAVGPDDVALTQGACGGDLLFAAAWVSRGGGARALVAAICLWNGGCGDGPGARPMPCSTK
jgi:hypothetical protein